MKWKYTRLGLGGYVEIVEEGDDRYGVRVVPVNENEARAQHVVGGLTKDQADELEKYIREADLRDIAEHVVKLELERRR